MKQYLKVGVITSTHGIRGEVKVFPTTDEPERFQDIKRLFLQTKNERMELEVAGVKFLNRW